MSTAQGPASGNGVVVFAPGNTGLEVQVPNGLPSLSPSSAPFVDPSASFTAINGSSFTPLNVTGFYGSSSIRIVNPA